MANEVLKEFLVAIGFTIREDQYKKQQALIAGVEKQLVANDKAARERDAAEKARQAAQQLRANETAAMLRVLGVNVAAFATAAAAAMSAVTVAIKNSIGEFDRLYYVSGRTGASVNNLKALGYAFKQTGSSAEAAMSAVDNFARARRANPGIDAMLRGYGINTKGDSSELLMNGIEAIRQRHPQFAGEQVAGLLGISSDEYDHLIRYRSEIARFTDEYKKLQGAMGVNGGETATAAKEIMRQFGRLSAVVEVFADKVTQTVAPAIEFLATKLGNLVEFIADDDKRKKFSEYFDPIIGATKTLVKWVGDLYDMFVKLFDYVRNSPLGKLLGAINPGFAREGILNFLQPSSAEASEAAGVPQEKQGIVRRGLNAIKRGLGIGEKADTSPITPGPHPILDLITKAEGTNKRGYNDSFNHQVGGSLTDKTLDEIEAIQRGMRGSSAIGKYQFMRATLKGLRKEMGLDGSERFTPELQDRLAMQLYRRRIAQAKREGGGNPAILKALAQEWASFPTASGQGYYPGQRAAVSPNDVLRAVHAEEKGPSAPAPNSPRAMPRFQMNPGGFDYRDYMNSAPMGSMTSSVDNSRTSDVKFGDTNVTIHGGGDARATADSFKRAAGDVNAMRLRDFQTAIR